jgi:hypothetical protein
VSRRRDRSQRLRTAVELLPRHTREAMLRGIDANSIIVGGYTDGEGGVCPMLAAHRNGGRTNFASFADAWDEFTGAGKRPRRASSREIRALSTYLELSLLEDDTRVGGDGTLAAAVRQIRSQRNEWAIAAEHRPCDYDLFEATVAAAHEQMSQRRSERQGEELLARR